MGYWVVLLWWFAVGMAAGIAVGVAAGVERVSVVVRLSLWEG